MKKIRPVIVLICTLYYYNIPAQGQQIDCATTILINQSAQNFMVHKYSRGFKAKKLNKLSEVKNKSPEQLMSSVLSATNLEWYNYNREKKKETTSQDFDYIKQAKAKDYYFELLYKVIFEANGNLYAVVKYYLHDKDKERVGFAESMKKSNDKWHTTSESEISQILFFMGMIDTQYIDAIFNNYESDNIKLNEIIALNNVNGKVDINRVLEELEQKLTEKDQGIISILDENRLFK